MIPMSMDDDYRGRDDAETLTRAEEIRGDRKRHNAAKKHLARKAKAVTAAADKSGARYRAENVVSRKDKY
jgi:hypothetical protein